jgi:hypothetical protein
MSRRHNERRFHRIYKFIDNGGICVYCGVRATTVDHFVPLSVVASIYGAVDVITGRVLIPSCGDCNSRAGSRMFRTIAAKRRYIQDRLKVKHKRLLASKPWTKDELDKLGYSLRTSVLNWEVQREWISRRIAWRNTMNPSAVNLAEIRSSLGAGGRRSVRQSAECQTTSRSAKAQCVRLDPSK